MWCDAGIVRDDKIFKLLGTFPIVSRIPNDRFFLCNVQPFVSRDETMFMAPNIKYAGGGKARIGGGILIGTIELWKQWDIWYDTFMNKYNQYKLFTGKEQTIMASIVLEHKDKISLLDAKPIYENRWFALLMYLGVNNTIFSILRNKKYYMLKMSIQQLIRVSQIA